MARRKHHGELWIVKQQMRPGIQQRSLFAVKRAARNNESQPGAIRPQNPCSLALCRGSHIEFEIPGDRYPLG